VNAERAAAVDPLRRKAVTGAPYLPRLNDRCYLGETDGYVVKRLDERGVVLTQYRRGYPPVNRLLSPRELAEVLETGTLRPYQQRG
jgi:hypothetical protein